jgi:hypothetical protein
MGKLTTQGYLGSLLIKAEVIYPSYNYPKIVGWRNSSKDVFKSEWTAIRIVHRWLHAPLFVSVLGGQMIWTLMSISWISVPTQ